MERKYMNRGKLIFISWAEWFICYFARPIGRHINAYSPHPLYRTVLKPLKPSVCFFSKHPHIASGEGHGHTLC